MKKVLVVGGGMGGLFTGALLAKEGIEVTVLEKNARIGGGLQTFCRRGEWYETGMHLVGGFQEGGPLDGLCRYLGIRDRLQLEPTDQTARVRIGNDEYLLPRGLEAFRQYLSGRFPDQAEGLARYVDALNRLYDEEPLLRLEPAGTDFPEHSAEFWMPADAFIAQYVTDGRLRSLLAFINPLYAGEAGCSPAFLHAIISRLFIEGSFRLRDSAALAEALKSVIEAGGGRVLAGRKVTALEVQDKAVVAARAVDAGGCETLYPAEAFVSDIHPCSLLSLVDEGVFPRPFARRLREIPNTGSVFKVFIKFRPGCMPYVNHPVYLLDRYQDVWRQGTYEASCWPCGLSCFMSPDAGRPGRASHMVVLAQMPFEVVKPWEDTLSGRRGEDYARWKQLHTERVLDKVAELFPHIGESIEDVFAASPLTFRDWYGTAQGSMYGYRKDCEHPALSRLAIRTKLGNLFLTGQNVNMHGIGGVPMTALETAEALVGKNVIINKINHITI